MFKQNEISILLNWQEIAETAEALKEEKQRRKEKRSSSGHGTDRSLSRSREPGVARTDELLPSSFSSGDGQSAEASVRNFGSTTHRTRYRSMNSVSDYSENESVENYNNNDLSKSQPPWKGMEKIHFFSKGEKIIVEKYSSIGQNVLGGRAYAGTLVIADRFGVEYNCEALKQKVPEIPVDWGSWKLLFNNQEYYSKFKDEKEWAEFYSNK